MLLSFSTANHLSLREKQELSLVASALRDNEQGLLVSQAISEKVLPVAVIYGANASGKSNVVDAFEFMRSAVRSSHNAWSPDMGVPVQSFALDPACADRRSSFGVGFVVEGVRYDYGFEATTKLFASEWLNAYPAGRRQNLFNRAGQNFEFGRAFKGRNKVIADLTRPNSLFLSAAHQNDHAELAKIVKFFSDAAILSDFQDAYLHTLEVPELMGRIVSFLRDVGTGVVHYRQTKEPIREEVRKVIVAMVEAMGTTTITRGEQLKSELKIADSHPKLELGHMSINGQPIYFDLQRESMGTRRLVLILSRALKALATGGVLLIDELDASLHTKACEAVVALFASPTTNPLGAQLIATTHDTNILRSPWLRRDQIWFTEKAGDGATHLYPLSDFHTRKGDNIEKGYLQGRYGAVPFAGTSVDLVEQL